MTAMSQIEFLEKNYIICICFKLSLALNKSGIECINFHSNSKKLMYIYKKFTPIPWNLSFYYILLANCHCIIDEFHPNRKIKHILIQTQNISLKSITEASKYSKLLSGKISYVYLHE